MENPLTEAHRGLDEIVGEGVDGMNGSEGAADGARPELHRVDDDVLRNLNPMSRDAERQALDRFLADPEGDLARVPGHRCRLEEAEVEA